MPGKLQMTLAVSLCAGAIAGCGGGGDGEIPRAEGEALLTRLEALEQQVRANECEGSTGAQAQAVEVARLAGELPESVDSEVRDAVAEAALNLVELTEEQCQEGVSGETGPQDETTTDTTTDTTAPTTTTTTTREETTTDTDTGTGGNQGGGGGAGGGPNQGGGNQGGGGPNQGGGNQGGGGQGDVDIEPPPDSGGVGTGERGS